MEVEGIPLLPLNADYGGSWMYELQNNGVEAKGIVGDGLTLCRRLGDYFNVSVAI